MTDIRYLAPGTLDEAVSAFAAAGSAARILAGGTDLLVQMRSGAVRPGLIVDIKKIAEMTGIEETPEGGFRFAPAAPGAGAGGAGRQSGQWLPARRQRARHDRSRRHRHAAGAERASRDAGGESAG